MSLAPSVPADPPRIEPLPLRLLRDEASVDRELAVASGASALLAPLAGVTVAGFGLHALCVASLALPDLGPIGALRHGGAWWAASTGGFFLAICAGLPSYWFHGVVAGIRAPAWRLAAELVRIQAVGAVVLAGMQPFWLAAALLLHIVFDIDVFSWTPFLALTYAMPFLCALPGVTGAYRSFARMRAERGQHGTFAPLILTGWWVGLFLHTAPVTIWALFHALAG